MLPKMLPKMLSLSLPYPWLRYCAFFAISFWVNPISSDILHGNAARSRTDNIEVLRDGVSNTLSRMGPDDPPVNCSAYYGRPSLTDCHRALNQYFRFPLDRSLYRPPWRPQHIRLVEFVTSTGLPGYDMAYYELPDTESYGDCIVSLTIESPASSDICMWRDVWEQAAHVLRACRRQDGGQNQDVTGGSQVFGEDNNLVVYVYSRESLFSQETHPSLSCVRGSAAKPNPKPCTRRVPKVCRNPHSDNESTFVGAPTACNAASDCGCPADTCSGKLAQNQNILWGLQQSTDAVIKFCAATLMDISPYDNQG